MSKIYPELIKDIRKTIGFPGLYLPISIASVFLIVFLVIRATFFFDNTYDVSTYGLPKIALYFQNDSIFHLSFLNDLRIDANERNGELIFLHCLLITDDIRYLGLAGVEVWLGIFISIIFAAKTLRINNEGAIAVGLLVASAPIIFGLSGITKGDSSAVLNFASASGFLFAAINYGVTKSRLYFILVALALAISCKMTIIFGCITILLIALICFSRNNSLFLAGGFKFYSIVLVSLSFAFTKQIQNIFIYAEPLKRAGWEKSVAGLKWNNLNQGFPDLVSWLLGLNGDLLPSGFQDDMGKGFGLVFLTIGAFAAINIFNSKLRPERNVFFQYATVILIAILLSALLLTSYIPNHLVGFSGNWTRFLAPYFVVIACISLALIYRYVENSRPLVYCFLSIITIASFYQIYCDTKPSNIISCYGRGDFLSKIFNYNRSKSRFGFNEGEAEIKSLYLLTSGKNIPVLVFCVDGDVPIYKFFGDNNNWIVTLTDDPKLFLNYCDYSSYKYIAIAHKTELPFNPTFLSKVASNCSFEKYAESKYYQIYNNTEILP
ncbi:MAG: hypothetical protein WCL71_00085 [Deltaproteobacteria bacterium]